MALSWTSVQEFYRYLRRPAPTDGSAEYLEAAQALEAAEGTVEDEAGQALAESTDDVIVDGPGGTKLILPRWPVVSVTSITLLENGIVLNHGADEDYTWSSAGIVTRRGDCWPCEDRSIQVVYTAGWNPAPISLRRIAWRLAATEADNPTGLESEKIGDWSGKWKSDVIAGALTEADRDIISRYAVRQ